MDHLGTIMLSRRKFGVVVGFLSWQGASYSQLTSLRVLFFVSLFFFLFIFSESSRPDRLHVIHQRGAVLRAQQGI